MEERVTGGVLCGWLSLIRLPNLVTVPGDPLAGFFTASAVGCAAGFINVLPCMVSALLLYTSGLILNDVADYEEDLRDRPARPLPSGRVSRRSALFAGLAGLVGGVACAGLAGVSAGVTAAGIAVLVLLYNFVTRRWALLGIVNMGACRGASVLLGASVLGFGAMSSVQVCKAAVCVAVYIAYVSLVAKRETEDSAVPARVGKLIRGLLILQALICVVAGGQGVVAGICLLCMWPIGVVLSRRHYAS